MTAADYASLLGTLWPLLLFLIMLYFVRQLRADLKPVVIGVVNGLAAQSAKNALVWARRGMFALLASIAALGEEAAKHNWMYVAIACKVIQPGLAAILASGVTSPAPTLSGNTTAPFQPPTS